MSSNISVIKQSWLTYQAEKKASTPRVEYVTPDLARKLAQKTAQEINILEDNLTAYKAVQRRAKPSMNSRVSKQTKIDIDMMIKLMQKYISDHETMYTAWKKLIKAPPKDRRVSRFPLRSKAGPRFVGLLNSYFTRTVDWIEKETIRNANLPVMPTKKNVVNVRKKTIRQAKNIPSVGNRLERTAKRTNSLARDLDRAKYEMSLAADNKTRATKKWKAAQAALEKASKDARALKSHYATDVNFYVDQIELFQEKLRKAERRASMAQIEMNTYKRRFELANAEIRRRQVKLARTNSSNSFKSVNSNLSNSSRF